jgi:hypothetical protein
VAYGVYLLLCFEVGSRLLLSFGPAFRRVRGRDDSTFRILWIRQHSSGSDFNYTFHVYHSSRGWALKPAINGMAVFDGKILNSNSKGLRGKTEYEYGRQAGKHRILALGDSFTFGDEVSDDETYAHNLERFLCDTEVLNLGVSGYGHDQMLLYLKQEGVKYQPDVVLVGFVQLDVPRNIFKFFGYAKPKFELHGNELRLTNVPILSPEEMRDREFYRLKMLDVGIMLYERLRWRFGFADRESRELTRAILDEIVATVRRAGAIPIFVYLPAGAEIMGRGEGIGPNERPLYNYCQERQLRCLFLSGLFQEAVRKGVKFNRQGHWQANGHAIVAQAIKEYLLDSGLIPRDCTHQIAVKDTPPLPLRTLRNQRSGERP